MATVPSAAPKRGSRTFGGLGWGSVVASLVALALAVSLSEPGRVIARLRAADPAGIVFAFLIGWVHLAALGLRWSRVSRDMGFNLDWLRATTEYALSLLGNQVLPSGMGGDRLRGFREAKSSRRGVESAFEALALDRASGQMALWLVVIVVAALPVSAGVISAPRLLMGLGVIGACAAGVWIAMFHGLTMSDRLVAVRDIVRRGAPVLLAPRRLLVHLPLSMLSIACMMLQLEVAARAVGVSIGWTKFSWIAPFVLVAASIPGFFGGWGVRELACALLFGLAGLSASAGVAVSILYGAFLLLISLPAAVVLIFDSQRELPPGEAPWTYASALSLIFGALLAAWLFHPPLLVCVAAFCSFVLVAEGRGRWTPAGGFGLPNLITTARVALTMGLLFFDRRTPGVWIAGGAGLILLLDVADGWLARRTGQSSPFGALYDVEADALLVMTVTLLLFARGTAGSWVLLAGLWRYLYVLAPVFFPTTVEQAPRSRYGRFFYVFMLVCFMLALILPGAAAWYVALFGTVAISYSFLHSFWQRYVPARTAR